MDCSQKMLTVFFNIMFFGLQEITFFFLFIFQLEYLLVHDHGIVTSGIDSMIIKTHIFQTVVYDVSKLTEYVICDYH